MIVIQDFDALSKESKIQPVFVGNCPDQQPAVTWTWNLNLRSSEARLDPSSPQCFALSLTFFFLSYSCLGLEAVH